METASKINDLFQNVGRLKKTVANDLNTTSNIVMWLVFLCNLFLLIYYLNNQSNWGFSGIFRINGFTLLIWTTVSFFSAIVGTYSANYLNGFKHKNRFAFLSLGFTFSVMLFIASDHIALFLLSWLTMGLFMSGLIGIDSDWGEAGEASKFAQKYFLLGGIILSAGVLLLAFASSHFTLSGILADLESISRPVLTVSALLILISAIIQSAIYPFHRWLLSAMTAPTPASALMHAGFVNGAGILLTLFSTLLMITGTYTLLFIIGGLTSIIAQFTKLLQTNVKQKLACSTIAQMGFMIMQCGLGFFNAAVAHLILHGFYKAYLFLSSGEHIQASLPEKQASVLIKPLQAVAVIVAGLMGAFLFASFTGKGTALNSGIFLTLIVAITVGQLTYNIIKQSIFSTWKKAFVPLLLFFTGIGCYAMTYNVVTMIMKDLPGVEVPLSLSLVHVIFGIVFLAGFFIMKLGIYRKSPWFYVKLLNVSQPYKKTILMFKQKSV